MNGQLQDGRMQGTYRTNSIYFKLKIIVLIIEHNSNGFVTAVTDSLMSEKITWHSVRLPCLNSGLS